MSIIEDFLCSTTANSRFLERYNLIPMHVVSFQCSAESKAEGIKKRWEQAEKWGRDNPGKICVLLLDEIGLAEHSRNRSRPLKILHQLLESTDQTIAFVGLSNWPLDAAKMNRVVMHQCYIHKEKDLIQTAQAIASEFYDPLQVIQMRSLFKAICGIYQAIMSPRNELQPRNAEFFGARDYYGVIKHFLSGQKCLNKTNKDIIVHFLRNFGGVDYNYNGDKYTTRRKDQKSFQKIIQDNLKSAQRKFIDDVISNFSPAVLVDMNINDKKSNEKGFDNLSLSRHVMVIAEHGLSWNVLLDLNILTHNNVFIFGSEFERDKSNIHLYLNHVMNCMETGKTLILCNLDQIHEALYDMLNQRYEFRHNKMYCRIALGSSSQRCFVHPAFKCIVTMSKQKAYQDNGTPIAFLNRFEKQLISYRSTLVSHQMTLLRELIEQLKQIYACDEDNFVNIFPGYCNDTLPSIIINHNSKQLLTDECIKVLFQINSTESYLKAICIKNKYQTFNDICLPKPCTLKQIIECNKQYKSIHDYSDEKQNESHNPIDYPDIIFNPTDDPMDVKSNNQPNKPYHPMDNKDEFDNINIQKENQLDCYEPNETELIVLLTYDFESNLNTKLPFLKKTIVKRMDEFGKVDEFKKLIKTFLKVDGIFNNLLLYY
eukprot:380827_1